MAGKLPFWFLLGLVATISLLPLEDARSQTLLRILDTPNPQAFAAFGSALAMGDADGDGKADLLVGANRQEVGGKADQGRAYLFSGATGALLRTFSSPNPQAGAFFGASVAMGDSDGDGKADLLVSASGEDVGVTDTGEGRAYLFSGTTGALLRTLDPPNPQEGAGFGGELAMGDADGDGRADFLVAASGEDVGGNLDQGRAYLFSGATGALLRTLDSPNPQADAFFGDSLAMGDTDSDGRADLLVGVLFEDVGGNLDQGRAYLFSGSTGALLATLDTPNPQQEALFGDSLDMGGAAGNGRADIVVSANGENVGANADQGRAYLFASLTLKAGDVDCNGDVSTVDALKILRHVAGLSVSQEPGCPSIGSQVASLWGDVDCNVDVTAVDALFILRSVAGLPVNLPPGCPPIGS